MSIVSVEKSQVLTSSPALEVRTKTLALAMDLVTTRTIEEMVQLLKKEVLRTAGGEHEDAGRYRQLLVRTLHACSIKFSDVAATVIPSISSHQIGKGTTEQPCGFSANMQRRRRYRSCNESYPGCSRRTTVVGNGEQTTSWREIVRTMEGAQVTPAQLVTSDGTYLLLRVHLVQHPHKEEKRPALVQYMMEGDFFIGASLATTLG
ncbi:hypothetical protein K0M31_004152 [Melipona bicolor]|uniref:Uncharacterized protein n=1 Tax=Melipona bicolor TaxID=60889 RepID=A0AA40FYA5_9HYME|nr:hypothetical protein K0M31_004152 [Melipona bicolor]